MISEFFSSAKVDTFAKSRKLREIGYEEKFIGLATEKLFQQLTHRTE